MSSKTFNLIGGSSSGIKLVSISIINPPDKTNYKPGEIFNPAGMKLQATYSNQATVIATGWTFTPDSPLSEDTNFITILYSEGGITVQTKQVITVTKKILQIPSQKGTLIYTGDIQSPSWNNYDNSEMLLTGTTSGLNANSYVAKFNLKNPIGTQWSDGSVIEKDVSWSIGRAIISSVPTQSGTLTYNGSVQSPKWTGYDSAKMKISGTTSSTNAGTFSASFTPTDNYKWNDGTINTKNVNWTIGKAAGSLSLSKSNITLNSTTKSTTFTITRAGDGKITVESNNQSVVTVSLNGTTVTVRSVNDTTGTATITVKVAAGTNHTAPSNKTCSVSCEFLPAVGTKLNDISWADIKRISDAGKSSSYFAIGDRKEVILNGTCSKLSFSNQKYYCYIIGIDHNSSREGSNRIHFQFGYTALSKGTHIAFISGYNDDSDFYMNSSNTNSGGWNNSFMRKTICAQFKNCLPTDLKSVLKSITKYSDNTGGGSNTASYVTATMDDIFLLAEYEVFGSRNYANSAEQNYQAQYQYYKNSNSKVRYNHNSTGTTAGWWLRSVYADYSYIFCRVYSSGSANYYYASCSCGFAPAFCV